MGLRRRNLVVWSQSSNLCGTSPLRRPGRARRIRGLLRIGMLVTLLGLLSLLRAVRARWLPLLAGTALTVAGLMLRGNVVASVLILPGITLLLYAPLIPGTSKADRMRRSKLERELAAYMTEVQRSDLEATLDRYPDEATKEIRDILARQAMAGRDNLSPIPGR
jgi:hypothetical protein